MHGLRARRRDEFDAAVAELRAAIRDRDEGDDDVRLRPALPALDRPVPQGRPAGRALPRSSSTTPTTDVEIPGAPYTFEPAQARPGDRRPADAARPRAARASASRSTAATRPRRCATSPSAIKEALLMQIGFVGLGKMGGNMVAPHQARLRPRVVAFDFERRGGRRRPRARRRRRRLARGPRQASSTRRGRSGSWCPPATPTAADGRRRSPSCSSTATRSSTAATRSGPTTSARAEAAARAGHPLRRRRHLRRRVGPRGRLLHDGRRPRRGGRRGSRRSSTCWPRRPERGARRRGWGHIGPDRRRPLREDGPQRRSSTG